MFGIAERFLSDIVVDKLGQYPISTDRGTWYPPQAFRFLNLNHHIHSFVYNNEKSLIERTRRYLKDRTKECFDDYFPCRKKNCKLNM
jgi:putative transposase